MSNMHVYWPVCNNALKRKIAGFLVGQRQRSYLKNLRSGHILREFGFFLVDISRQYLSVPQTDEESEVIKRRKTHFCLQCFQCNKRIFLIR